MRIGIDLDGVCYHWDRTARYLLRERFYGGKDYPPALNEVSKHWDWISEQVSKEAWRWLWKEGVKQGLFRHGHVIKGTVEGMHALAQAGHKLVIITHRPAVAVNDTLAWLAFMNFDLAGVHILTEQEPKSEVPCDVYLDDKPENIQDFVENTDAKLVAMYQQPWNEDHIITKGGVPTWGQARRVASWQGFVKLVREL